MVYRKLDPAADWDAYCDDHPDMPGPEDVDEMFHVFECPDCKSTYTSDDVEDGYAVVKGDDVHCSDCRVQCELEVDYDAFDKYHKEAAAEAKAERMMDDA